MHAMQHSHLEVVWHDDVLKTLAKDMGDEVIT
jgi:hypothetical protein